MAIPKSSDLRLPILTEMSKENRAFSPKELAETLKPKLGVTDSDMKVTRQNGYPTYKENLHRAIEDLTDFGFIKNQEYGYHILTAEGRAFLANPNKSFKGLPKCRNDSKKPTS